VTADFDVAIVGSGFGGSLLAMIARRIGLDVVLVERGRHPRFAIGESASPLAGAIIEDLADRYDLPRIRPIASYGEWRRQYPEVVCGVKRGFTYFKHAPGHVYAATPYRSDQLLVAASPCEEVADTHWLRADVDHFLVREAIALGVEYLDETTLDSVDWQPSGHVEIGGARFSSRLRFRSRLVIDASGPRGFLWSALALGSPGFAAYPATQALYSHFIGVARCEDMPEYASSECPPFPIDAAALHHVFDDGWMWVLRFDNGVTSAGVAVTDALASELRLSEGEPAWRRLLAYYPTVAAQFADARPIREFTWMPRVAFRTAVAAGPGWALLPSAAAFVDPLFSTGIPLTLLGIERLAAWLETVGDSQALVPPAAYSNATLAEADHTARFIAGCYAGFPRFSNFVAYSMFYFAAASFSEMARRLKQGGRGFLCADDVRFRYNVAALASQCRQRRDLHPDVARAVDRFNVAGLCDPSKRNWYGVDLNDAIRAAHKLGAEPSEVARVLASAMNVLGVSISPG
jgi:tetracycline 7-halogenase / FADH2 O2-dependent halogenase